MAFPDTAKPALASCGEPAPEFVGSGGLNNHLDTKSSLDLQVSRLTRLYAVNAAMAETIAPLVFLEVVR